MSSYESPKEAELRIACERAVAGLDAMNDRLRACNDLLAGRRPRPQLKVIKGGRDA
jgi:hypothetical protein